MIRSTVSASVLAACCGLASAQFGTNLVTNGDFEQGNVLLGLPNDWQLFNNPGGIWTQEQNRTPGGASSITIPLVAGFNAWQPQVEDRPMLVPISPDGNGGPVTLSFWYNIPDPAVVRVMGGKIDWFFENGAGAGGTGDLNITSRDTGGAWEQAVFTTRANGDTIIPPTGATRARIFLQTFHPGNAEEGPAQGTVYFDDVSLTQAEGNAPCPADVFNDGILNVNDVITFVNAFNNEQNLPGPDDNRVLNGSFEDADPDMTENPLGWFTIGGENAAMERSQGFDTGGVDGAPAARTGTRLVSVGDDDNGGFSSWSMDATVVGQGFRPNDQNPFRFEFWYNIPTQTPAFDTGLFASKVEWVNLNDDGTFGGLLGGTPDIVINPDLTPTDGWQPFSFTIQAAQIPPAADAFRILLFTFDPDGTPMTGRAYFDDVGAFQQAVPSRQADVAFDGILNVNDVIEFVNSFNAGCP